MLGARVEAGGVGVTAILGGGPQGAGETGGVMQIVGLAVAAVEGRHAPPHIEMAIATPPA